MAVGKWHLAPMEQTTAAGPYTQWPLSRGFEHFTDSWKPRRTASIRSCSSTTTPWIRRRARKRAITSVRTWSTGRSNSSRTETSVTPDSPSSHVHGVRCGARPAPGTQEYLDKYRGRFDHGWDVERATRHARQIERGVLRRAPNWHRTTPGSFPRTAAGRREEAVRTPPGSLRGDGRPHRPPHRPVHGVPGADRPDRDHHHPALGQRGQPKQRQKGSLNPTAYQNGLPEDFDEMLARIDEIGTTRAHANYPWGWAQAGNAPFKRYKQNTHEGGVRLPAHRAVAPGAAAHRRDQAAVPPCQRHRPDPFRTARSGSSRGLQRHPANADPRCQHGLHLRLADRADAQGSSALRDVRAPRDLARRLEGRRLPRTRNFDTDQNGSSTTTTPTSRNATIWRRQHPDRLQDMIERWWPRRAASACCRSTTAAFRSAPSSTRRRARRVCAAASSSIRNEPHPERRGAADDQPLVPDRRAPGRHRRRARRRDRLASAT